MLLAVLVGLFLCAPAWAHRPHWLSKREARHAIVQDLRDYYRGDIKPSAISAGRCHRHSRSTVVCREKIRGNIWESNPYGVSTQVCYAHDIAHRRKSGRITVKTIPGGWCG
jgi:hypothetical protein